MIWGVVFGLCALVAAFLYRQHLRSEKKSNPLCNCAGRELCKATSSVSLAPSLQACRFVLIRHGERLDHVDRSWKGPPSSDPPLSALGRRQAVETALYFRLERVRGRSFIEHTTIESSPFLRCLQTAAIVNVIGFDGKCSLKVNVLLADFAQSKVFASHPTVCGFFVDKTNFRPCGVEDVVLQAAEIVQNDQHLMRRFGVKDKTIEKWKRFQLPQSLPMFDDNILQAPPLTNSKFAAVPLTSPFPEKGDAFRTRCLRALNYWRPKCSQVIAFTHADVIQAVLSECCPRSHHHLSSSSPPYCSITRLRQTPDELWTLEDAGTTAHLATSLVQVQFRH